MKENICDDILLDVGNALLEFRVHVGEESNLMAAIQGAQKNAKMLQRETSTGSNARIIEMEATACTLTVCR